MVSVNIAAGSNTTEPIPGNGNVAANAVVITANPTLDAVVEADEEIQIQIDSHNGAGAFYTAGTPAQATGLIFNDDAVVTVAVNPTSVPEGNPAGPVQPNLVFTFSRTGGTGLPLVVTYTIGGSATNGTDYATIVTTVTIPAGFASAQVVVNPTEDLDVENDETVTLTPVAGAGYTIGAAPGDTATGTISNDDTGVSVTVAGSPAAEGNVAPGVAGSGTLTYTFSRGVQTSGNLSVNYSISGGTNPASAGDYTGGGNGVVVIPDGSVEHDPRHHAGCR